MPPSQSSASPALLHHQQSSASPVPLSQSPLPQLNQPTAGDSSAASAFVANPYPPQAAQQPRQPSPQQQGQFQIPSQSSPVPPLQPDTNKSTLWMGDLEPWMDENYIKQLWYSLGENVTVKMIRDKSTGTSAGYCFVDFGSHTSALRQLSTVQGFVIPGTNRIFKLNWASGGGLVDRKDTGPEYSIFVGDLGQEVNDAVLMSTFQSRYESCKTAKVVTDAMTGMSRGYGFVRFSNEIEQQRAMTEMQGQYCGARPMRISAATPKNRSNSLSSPPAAALGGAGGLGPGAGMAMPGMGAMGMGIGMISMGIGGPQMGGFYGVPVQIQGGQPPPGPGGPQIPPSGSPQAAAAGAYGQYSQFTDPTNTTVFVGGLSPTVGDDELRSHFSQFGEIVYTKIPPGKGCGFVQYAHRQSAEIAIQQMNNVLIGGSRVRLSWGKSQAALKGPTYGRHGRQDMVGGMPGAIMDLSMMGGPATGSGTSAPGRMMSMGPPGMMGAALGDPHHPQLHHQPLFAAAAPVGFMIGTAPPPPPGGFGGGGMDPGGEPADATGWRSGGSGAYGQ
ncbi:hypothetical protein HK405_011288 [Cladochytrium tenue]|nr:hypothetical protein HK405_011288 [Cladochytrium tenue]